MPGPGRRQKLPRKGDRKIDHRFLEEASSRLDHLNRLTVSGGEFSNGPSGPTIIIPEVEPSETLKLIQYDWLPAAFGGTYGNYPTSALGQSYGNFVPDAGFGTDSTARRRKMYQRTCNQWKFVNNPAAGRGNSYFDQSTDPNLQVMNPFDLPLVNGLAWVHPINPSEPSELQYVVINPIGPNPWGAMEYNWTPSSASDFRLKNGYGDGTSLGELLGTDSGAVSSPGFPYDNYTSSWIFRRGGDVFLPYPGTYKVTFGAKVCWGIGGSTYIERHTTVDNSHTHRWWSADIPAVTLKVFRNYEPGVVVSIPAGNGNTDQLTIPVPNSYLTSGGYSHGERSFTFQSNGQAFHGGPYTRLSLGATSYIDTLSVGYDPALKKLRVLAAWMIVEPLTNRPGVFGGGANVFPSGYVQNEGARFKWWGGGPEPPFIHADGSSF